jgi:hypothetical protein
MELMGNPSQDFAAADYTNAFCDLIDATSDREDLVLVPFLLLPIISDDLTPPRPSSAPA